MNWPPASDYQDAIQNPATCFQDLELKAGQVSVNKIGLPRVASGNFASVYEMRNGAHRWAVRCFLRQGEDQQNRYALLSLYLAKLIVPGLVEFSYQQEGIRVRGKWYPVVKMEWVEGETLTTYVQKNLHQPETLRNLALQWRGLIDRLRQHQIAHADLQHGNVMVSPQGQLRLVDYDGMYVPSLRGRKSSELGHINYQHPKRTPDNFDERLDNFSALVIYTALMALSVEPGLWKRFDTGENMLFTAQDFRLPSKSVLFEYLREHHDPALGTLAEKIMTACQGSVAQTPDFRTAVDGLAHGPLPERWWQNAAPDGSPVRPTPRIVTPQVPPMPSPRSTVTPAPPAPLPTWYREPIIEVAPEVAYEKIAPPRPTLHAVRRTAASVKATKASAKKHPSPHRVQ
jgi:serine/threonine protein kinase